MSLSLEKKVDDLSKEFEYKCLKCNQMVVFKVKDRNLICNNFLIIDGAVSEKVCYGTEFCKPKKKGWRYDVAR